MAALSPPLHHLYSPKRPIFASAPARPEKAAARPVPAGPATARNAQAPLDRKQPWWVPLFPSLDPDRQEEGAAGRGSSEEGEERREGVRRPAVVVMTAEKAKALRRELRAMETWHDRMYHSAIASRLASPDESIA